MGHSGAPAGKLDNCALAGNVARVSAQYSRKPPPANEQDAVIDFLGRAETYGLDAPPQRIDTHAAIVFLAGDRAYKIKRAAKYPYLDFSTPERRRAACEAEIHLNRPGAPEIYIGVLPVVRRHGAYHLGGEGEVVEWAVHMRRFDPDATLDRVADRGSLTADILTQLVERIVAAHRRAPRRDGNAATIHLGELLSDNVAALEASSAIFPPDRVAALGEAWREAYDKSRPILIGRGRGGHVRRCHGDLHLRNIALIDDRPVLFDALEFDDRLATSDLLYDLAFLLMDLWERGMKAAANAVLNRYLWQRDEESDLAALNALPLFMSLRASIRAKVAVDTLPHLEPAARRQARERASRYFDIAEECMQPTPPRLVGIGGLSGSGKTTASACLAPWIGNTPGAVHLRSDIERKRLFGVADSTRLPEEAYRMPVTEEVYAQLRRKTRIALDAGHSVVVDAVHEQPEERRLLEAVAEDSGVPFSGFWLEATEAELVRRVSERQGDASDADAQIVQRQLARKRRNVEWPHISSGGAIETVCARALRLLGIDRPPQETR